MLFLVAALLWGLVALTTLLGATPALADGAAGPSPAERRIELAKRGIEKSPGSFRPYNDLAMAFARRARETSDVEYYDRAEETLRKSFELQPGNLQGRKVRAWVLLGKHDFAAALEEASALQRRVPDDVMVYGLLVDAHVQLGNYVEAEQAAQWMLDLRPGNVPALTRAAYLRELFGDLDGATEMMMAAFVRTRPTEREERAWLLTQIGHLHLSGGDAALAAGTLEKALEIFPGYHYALAGLAQARAAQGRFEEAVALRRRHVAAAPHPENLFYLGRALERAGRREEARATFAAFERAAREEMSGADNANRELVFFYVDHAQRPREALRIARREARRRQDVYTLDALAWAQQATGDFASAQATMSRVLEVGLADPEVRARSRRIAELATAPRQSSPEAGDPGRAD